MKVLQGINTSQVGYAKGYLFNSIIGKAHSKVVGHYGLTGDKECQAQDRLALNQVCVSI